MNLYEDLKELESKEVNNLNSFLESKYRTLSKKEVGNDSKRFAHLSRDISAKYNPKIIEVLESRIEHDFKTKILLRFFAIAYFPLFAFLGSSQLYQSLNIHQSSFLIGKPGINLSIQFSIQFFFAVIALYIFFVPNAKKAHFLRILRYALIVKRYPEND
jgi:hypothetical protein